MDTVSDELSFTLKVIKEFPFYGEEIVTNFSENESEIWMQDFVSISIEENDDILIYFNSEDKQSRIYLDALDIVQTFDDLIQQDEEGRLFRYPSDKPFILYKSNAGYDALRVDTFKISILSQGKWLYGTMEVLPKPMNLSEWKMMKSDLEQEITGLAQDIVRRSMGIGNVELAETPPKYMYDFLVIKKYSKSVLASLVDITEKPRYNIQTQYAMEVNTKKLIFDKETIKRYVYRSGSEPTFKVPKKVVNYDIQDNRILKMILQDYEKRIDNFLELLKQAEEYSNFTYSNNGKQYISSWKEGIIEFKETALKLRKMTSILKTKDWYFEISDVSSPYIPHSFVLDTRYNILYQMYLELRKDNFSIKFDSMYSYTWKRSSYLYEMWCFIKLCKMLSVKYTMSDNDWNMVFSNKILFPFLRSGTAIEFENDIIKMDVIFDTPLPLHSKDTNEEYPLYIAKSFDNSTPHNRPDILMNIFDKRCNWYLGSIVVECKYRKLASFLSNTQRSSLDQLETYYNNARSKCLYGTLGERMNSRPVSKVIVLTPDMLGEGRQRADFNILVKALKPHKNENIENELISEICKNIEKMIQNSNDLQNIK